MRGLHSETAHTNRKPNPIRWGRPNGALAEEPCPFAVKTAPTVPVECPTCRSGLDREKGRSWLRGSRWFAALCLDKPASTGWGRQNSALAVEPCLFAIETRRPQPLPRFRWNA